MGSFPWSILDPKNFPKGEYVIACNAKGEILIGNLHGDEYYGITCEHEDSGKSIDNCKGFMTLDALSESAKDFSKLVG